MKERVALLDFDGTLINVDSFSFIMRHEKWFFTPRVLLLGIQLIVSILVKKNELAARSRFKEELLNRYLRLDQSKKQWYVEQLKSYINYNLVSQIKAEGYSSVIIISASEEKLIRQVIDDVLPVTNIIANSLDEEPFVTCWGSEKVGRFLSVYPNRAKFEIDSFSDSYSDQPLFDISDNAYIVNNNKIEKIK